MDQLWNKNGKQTLTEEEQTYFSFCFVRHPVERVTSAYSMLANWELTSPNKEPHQDHKSKTISEYVQKVLTNEMPVFHQCEFLPFKNGKPQIDFIGKFHNLKEDWAILQQKFDLRDLTSNNRSQGLKYTKTVADLTNEEIQALEEKYADDMEAFGFVSKLEA
jgi:hypothetical protein